MSDLNLKIKSVPIENLVFDKKQVRKHLPASINKLKSSLKEFGLIRPILVDKDNKIICGYGIALAAKELGHKIISCISIEHLSTDQIRAYKITDNKLAECSEWNSKVLSDEIIYLFNNSFDVNILGFEPAEIDLFLTPPTNQDNLENLDLITRNETTVSKKGDIWLLGNNKIFCGDATNLDSYKKLLIDKKANAVFTDPPYNVPISGHVCGNGAIKHKDFEQASGEMTPQEFIQFLSLFLKNTTQFLSAGGILFCCMDWRHTQELEAAATNNNLQKINLCIWNKSNAGMGSLYRSKHELIYVFKNGKAKHINNVMLGKYGRNRSNIWDYPSVNTFGNNDLEMHPTVKPIALVEDAIRDVSKAGDIVFDPFLGSGTTIIAAERCKRIAYGIELDPTYIDLIVQRWQDETGNEAIHSLSGKSFNSLQIESSNKDGGKNVRKR